MRRNILLTLLFLMVSAHSAETDFVLEANEEEEILAIIESSLRSDPWNSDISDQRAYVYSVDDYSVRVVEIVFSPFHLTSSVKHNYQVSCIMEIDSDTWDCQKELARYVYPSRAAEWALLLDDDLAEEEAIDFLNKVSENKVLSWKEKDIEFEFDELSGIGIGLGSDGEFIDIYTSHERLGHVTIEIPRSISGRVTEISRIISFFILCEDGSMQYGIDACEQGQ